MARGRMVNKKICNSQRVNELPIEAELLYTWIIPHLDVNGIFYGAARMVKSLVFPRKKFTEKQVEKWLVLMENTKNSDKIPLIFRYKVGDEQYLWMPGFQSEQSGLRKDKEKPEYRPPAAYPIFETNEDQKFPTFDGKNTETIRPLDGNNTETGRKRTA